MRQKIKFGSLELGLDLDDGKLAGIELPPTPPPGLTSGELAEAVRKLRAMPLANRTAGAFTQAVWEALKTIPRGETRTYGELARALGNPRASRAIGSACGANPLPLLVPCHRVVAQNGLGGFSGGLAWKQALLALEAEAENVSIPRRFDSKTRDAI